RLGGQMPSGRDRMPGLTPAFRAVTGVVGAGGPVPQARQEPGIARLGARAVAPRAARTSAGSARSVTRHLRHRQSAGPTARVTAGSAALQEYLTRVENAD